jgi:ABC-2 type transport system ATP-binding protein
MAEGELLAGGTPDELRASVQSEQMPDPTMEDAFIHLIQNRETARRSHAMV